MACRYSSASNSWFTALTDRVLRCRGCRPGSRRDSRARPDGSAARAPPEWRAGTRAHRTRGSPRSRIGYFGVVGVDQVVAVILVPGQMDLLHALRRNGVQVLERIELVVHRAHGSGTSVSWVSTR